MAVAVTAVIPGATTDQYDEINREGGISESSLPEGLVAHYAVKTEDGLRIFDIWQSREQFDQFMERLMPTFSKVLGDVPQMQPEVGELHNVFARK